MQNAKGHSGWLMHAAGLLICLLLCMAGLGIAHGSAAAQDASAGQLQAGSAVSAGKVDIRGAKVSHAKTRKCTNNRIKPKVTVVLGGRKLQRGVDFTVSYANNKKPGKAAITIMGIGNYSGTIVTKFKITGTYKPLILVADKSRYSASSAIDWLKKCGCRTAFVKSVKNVKLSKYDGLAIPGGGDVHPSFYGEKNTESRNIYKWLDKMQFKLIRKFAAADKPVLGICRGAQVVNVAFGGSLHQDVGGYHIGSHKTTVKKGSWLYKMFGSSYSTWHYHHQAVKRVGKGLVATQWCKKGKRKIIEMVEGKNMPVWGVQFHPEAMGHSGYKIGRKFRWECVRRVH